MCEINDNRDENTRPLTKSLFLAGMQCPLNLWYSFHRKDLIPLVTPAEQARMNEGIEVGKLACELFSGGERVDIENLSYGNSVKRTQDLMENNDIPAIFEASFELNGVRTRVDILKRAQAGKWDINEVKSTTSIREEHFYDIGYQYLILKDIGITVGKAELIYLNKDYVYDGMKYDLKSMFTSKDISAEIKGLESQLSDGLRLFREVLAMDEPPKAEPSPICKACIFSEHCTKDKPKNWTAYLLRISGDKWKQLAEMGVEDIKDIPEDFKLSEIQKIVRGCCVSGKEYIGPDLKETLNALEFPIYFLDFESLNTALPHYAGTKPYQQMVFQWSCHVLHENGKLEHFEFLHNNDTDPRDDSAKKMLDCLGRKGTIVHYAPFEKSRIKELAEDFPTYKTQLTAVSKRLWDLCQAIQKSYYHPDFGGSYSIKQVLPVLVPTMTYENLDIRQGDMAALGYQHMISPLTPDDKKQLIKEALLKYCGQDSLAMVEIYKVLKKKAGGTP